MDNNNKAKGSDLMGYVRLSKAGGALKLSLHVSALKVAHTFKGKEGEMVDLIINAKKAREILEGSRTVTSVSQIQKD